MMTSPLIISVLFLDLLQGSLQADPSANETTITAEFRVADRRAPCVGTNQAEEECAMLCQQVFPNQQYIGCCLLPPQRVPERTSCPAQMSSQDYCCIQKAKSCYDLGSRGCCSSCSPPPTRDNYCCNDSPRDKCCDDSAGECVCCPGNNNRGDWSAACYGLDFSKCEYITESTSYRREIQAPTGCSVE